MEKSMCQDCSLSRTTRISCLQLLQTHWTSKDRKLWQMKNLIKEIPLHLCDKKLEDDEHLFRCQIPR